MWASLFDERVALRLALLAIVREVLCRPARDIEAHGLRPRPAVSARQRRPARIGSDRAVAAGSNRTNAAIITSRMGQTSTGERQAV